MLQNIRDRLSGPIVWFVIGLICIPFAFWGIESFKGGSADPIVAKVGDHDITQAEFRQSYEQRYQQLQQMMGDNFKPELIDQARFRKSVLDDMVQEQTLRQYTHEAGYRASDAAVFQYLSSVPAFQENGRFSETLYRDLLSKRGMNPGSFEGQLRESLVIDQLRESISDSAFVTDDEAMLAYRISTQARDIGVAALPVEKFKAQASVTEDQIAKRYEASKASYMAPERLKVAYVDLDLAALPKAESPGPDVLKVIYDAEKDSRFASQEERRARHILVSFGADKGKSKDKIEKLAEQLKGGANFSDLAKQNSDDPGSKAAGGDLGWVKRGMMTKTFEDALFDLKSGETSGPVQTEFGWHLIHVDEVKAPAVRPFADADVQAELLEVWQQRDAQKRFQDQAEKIEQLAFENPTSLDAVAKALNLQVKTSDWFARTGPAAGIAGEAVVKTAAFSQEVLTDNENSKPLPLGPSRILVIRKSEYEAPRQRTLAEVTDTIRDELKLDAAKAQAKAKSQELLAALRSGSTLETAATAACADVLQNGPVKRTDSKPERMIIDAAFKLPRPAASKPSIGDVTLANGDLAVIVLRSVEEPPAGGVAATKGLANQLRDTVAGSEFGAMRKALEKDMKVEIVTPPAGTGPAAPAAGEGG